MCFSDVADGFGSELAGVVFDASRMDVDVYSAFPHAVLHVVLLRAEKEMVRSHTCRVVALVADKFLRSRHLAEVEHPGDASGTE